MLGFYRHGFTAPTGAVAAGCLVERWAGVDHVVTSLDESLTCLAHSHWRSSWWRVFVRPSALKPLTARFWSSRFTIIRPFVPSGRGFALLASGGPRRLWSPDCQTVQAGRPFFRLWPAFAYILLATRGGWPAFLNGNRHPRQGTLRGGDLVVAALAGPFQDLERWVELTFRLASGLQCSAMMKSYLCALDTGRCRCRRW